MKPPNRKDVQYRGRMGGLPCGTRRQSPWAGPQHTIPTDIWTMPPTYRSLEAADVAGAASAFASVRRRTHRGAQMTDRGRQGPIVGPARLGARLRGSTQPTTPVQLLCGLHPATATAAMRMSSINDYKGAGRCNIVVTRRGAVAFVPLIPALSRVKNIGDCGLVIAGILMRHLGGQRFARRSITLSRTIQ
jgi:hypothetical protein